MDLNRREKMRKLTACGLTSIFVTLALSGTAFADIVEITGDGKNTFGDKIKIMVSGESVNGSDLGVSPGLTGMAKLTCGASNTKETVIITGSEADLNTPSLPPPANFPISCPIQFFYSAGRIITINPCDTPPTIGGDFAGCTPAVFGETTGDKVHIKYTAKHTAP